MCDFQTRAMLVARSIRAARLAMAGGQTASPEGGETAPERPLSSPLQGFGCACGRPMGHGRGTRPVFAATSGSGQE